MLAGKGIVARSGGGMAISTGLSAAFTRNIATRDDNGAVSLANAMRFGTPRLLVGSQRTPESHFSSSNFILGKPGYASDNTTPMWVVLNGVSQMILWSGTFSGGGNAFNIQNVASTASPGRSSAIVDALLAAGITTDLFKQQSGITAYADECWMPRMAVVINGVVVALCQVGVCATGDDHTDSSKWHTNYVGLAVCKASTWLSSPGTGWFTQPPRSGALHAYAGGSIGAAWALNWFKLDRDGAAPLKIWVTGVDYQSHPDSHGGIAYVMPLVRSGSTSDDWADGDVGQTVTISDTDTTNLRHAHASALVRQGSLGIIQVVSTGDGVANQSVCQTSLSSEGSAVAADTSYLTGGSVPSGARRWWVGMTAWATVPSTGTGGGIDSGTLDATGVTTPGTNSASTYAGNQFVGADSDGTKIFCGLDQGGEAIAAFVPNPGTPIAFSCIVAPRRVRAIPPTGTPANLTTRTDCFYINARNPLAATGGFTASTAPGVGSTTQYAGARLIWSPDWKNAATVFPSGTLSDRPSFNLGGRIYYSTAGASGAVLSIAEPTAYRVIRPILISPGATNYANSTYTVTNTSTGSQADISEVDVQDIPPGLAEMPDTTNVIRVLHPGTSSANCCVIRLADSVPIDADEILIRFKLFAPLPATRSPAVSNTLNIGYYVRVSKNSDDSSPITSGNLLTNLNVEHGTWIPVTLRVKLQPLVTFGSGTARINLGVVMNNGQAAPFTFYLARGGVFVCDATTGEDAAPYPIAPGVTGPDEALAVTGFGKTFVADWTFAASVNAPMRGDWDEVIAPIAYMTNAVLDADLTHTTLTGGPSTDIISGGLLVIGTESNSGICGLPISAYDTGTKIATHAAVTTGGGIVAGTVTATVRRPLIDTGTTNYRPRHGFALLTADGQTGLLIYVNTSPSLTDGSSYHTVGVAYVTGGVVDWGTSIDGVAIPMVMAGDRIDLALTHDTATGYLTLSASVAGSAMTSQADFGALLDTWFTTEVLDLLRVGCFVGRPTPLEVSYAFLADSAFSEETLSGYFDTMEFYSSVPQRHGALAMMNKIWRYSGGAIVHVLVQAGGAPITGLAYNSSGMVLSLMRVGTAAPTVFTAAGGTIETITTIGTFAAPTSGKIRFKEIDATNTPGLYEVHIASADIPTTLPGANIVDRMTLGIINPNLIGSGECVYCEMFLEAIAPGTAAEDNQRLMFNGTGYAGGTTKLGTNVISVAGSPVSANGGVVDANVVQWQGDAVGAMGGGYPGVDIRSVNGELAQGGGGAGVLGVDAVLIAGISAPSPNTYFARIQFQRNDVLGRDEYTVAWYKNAVPVAVTGTPNIQVVSRASGSDVIAATPMTQVGSTNYWKYSATSQLSAGAPAIAIATATIDGATRTFTEIVGRDLTATA